MPRRRYRIVGYQDVSISDTRTLLEEIRLERRLELCYEGHRWYDLKRTKLFAKQIDHKFTLVNSTGGITGTEIYMLSPNDPNYVYPIPQGEMDRNGAMEQNGRVDKLPIKEDY